MYNHGIYTSFNSGLVAQKGKENRRDPQSLKLSFISWDFRESKQTNKEIETKRIIQIEIVELRNYLVFNLNKP